MLTTYNATHLKKRGFGKFLDSIRQRELNPRPENFSQIEGLRPSKLRQISIYFENLPKLS